MSPIAFLSGLFQHNSALSVQKNKTIGSAMKFIDEITIKGKKVLFRFDFNVPLDSSQNITDDTRIRAVLPSINYALDEKARVIIMSHLGRPQGKAVHARSLAA